MFNIGPAEMIVIVLVLLIAVGPEQLPGVIRKAGRTAAQVRSMTEGLRADFMSGLDEIERSADPTTWAASETKPRPSTLQASEESGSADGGAEVDSGSADGGAEVDSGSADGGAEIDSGSVESGSKSDELLEPLDQDGTQPDTNGESDDTDTGDRANGASASDDPDPAADYGFEAIEAEGESR